MDYVDISGAIADAVADRRDSPDQGSLLPTDRWLGTLTLVGHGEDTGVSWVTFADSFGMRWGYLWPWRDLDVEEDFELMAVVDLDDFVMTGEFSAPDAGGVRWLLAPAWVESHRPQLLPAGSGRENVRVSSRQV